MSDGSHKPAYVPPTIGGELERAGMKYDFEAGVTEKKQQKRDRKRNKGSRRDNNNSRPTKEVSMEGSEKITNVNGTTPSPREEGNNNVSQVMAEGFRNLRSDLSEFAGKIVVSNADLKAEMPSLLGRATETTIGEVQRRSNEWSLENIKGDVRRALVQVGVGGIVAGAIALGTYLFSRDDADVMATDGRSNAQTNGASRSGSARAQA